VFQGISAADFQRHYAPVCKRIERDNTIGKFVFTMAHQIQRRGSIRRAVIRNLEREQAWRDRTRRMSMVMWDLFTGSATYRDILGRMLHPTFIARFGWDVVRSVGAKGNNN